VIFVWRDLGVNIARFNASSSSMIMKLLWLGISVIWLGAGLGLFLSFAPAFAQEYQPPSDLGQEYVWTVVARCPSAGEIYARASLRRVELTSELEKALSVARSNQDRARIFAQQGLWHDALAAGDVSDYFWRLLAEIGVRKLGDLADAPKEATGD